MALVVDHNDPMDLGMFSKPGRFTSEKYIIFQKKDEILNNQRKFLKVTSLPHLKMDFDGKDRKPALDDEDLKPRPTTLTKQGSRPSPFSTQISREEYYEVKVKVKNPPPPCGFYNPKYEHVEKGSRLLFQYDKEKKSDQFRSTMRDFSPEEASKPIPDKLKKKVVGPIPFHQQTPKGSITTPKNNPHEERFNYLESPKNWGKMKRVLTVDMSKTLKRDMKFLYKDLEYSPDYDPNFEFGKKQLGSPGPRFETHSPRKPMHYSSSCTNENFYDSAKKETLKYFKPRDTFFDKYTARDWDSSCPLPSFMQKSVNSRIAIGTLRQKTLETNGFSDGKFQTVTTSFFPKK